MTSVKIHFFQIFEVMFCLMIYLCIKFHCDTFTNKLTMKIHGQGGGGGGSSKHIRPSLIIINRLIRIIHPDNYYF